MRAAYRVTTLAAIALVLATGTVSSEDIPKGAVKFTSTELKWKPSPRVAGLETADMVGDSSKLGAYTYRVKFPANFSMQAHSHPEDRSYTIVSGTWYIGWGKKYDTGALTALPPGSFYTEPANVPHFVATRDEPVVVQISGTGPTAVKYVEPAHQAKGR
jgi:quercetin dioxygenase-like cupin family protein